MEDSCSGRGISGQAWFDYWNENDCTDFFESVLFTNSSGQFQYNEEALPGLQEDFKDVFSTYQLTNQFVDPGQTGYNPFQSVIIDACVKLPNVCYIEQTNFCAGRTDTEISTSETLVQICGCVAPPPQLPSGVTLQTACTGLCSRVGVIPNFDSNGNVYECTNVCVIDDVSIAATDSTIGSVNFNQVCNNCTSQSCLCIVEGVSVSDTMTSVGLTQTSFSQSCGPSSVCIQDATDGTQTIVACTSSSTPVQRAKLSTIFIIVLVIIVLFILFIILLAR